MVLYRALSRLLWLAALARWSLGVVWSRLAGGRAPEALAERLFPTAGHATNGSPRLWIHGASNGELTSARMLIERLVAAHPDAALIITTNSVTARDMVRGWRLPQTAAALAPLDAPAPTRRFLDRVRPDALVVIENELWPNRLTECAARQIPVLVVGARMSARSAQRWQRLGAIIRPVLRAVRWLSPQDEAARGRFVALGLDATSLGPTQALKATVRLDRSPADAAIPGFDRAQTVLAASTHAGEEAVVLDAFRRLRDTCPAAHLILAPRHPRRLGEIEALLHARGLAHATRSRGEVPGPETAVYLADTMGEMALWYQAAALTFVGGSLGEHGGHTPYEPASFNSAILHGPHVENFADAYRALDDAEGARQVRGADDLAAAMASLLAAPEQCLTMAGRASRVLQSERPGDDPFAPLLAALEPCLMGRGRRKPDDPAAN